LFGLVWANLRFGKLFPVYGDFLAQWAALRVYVTEGIQPYSPQAWDAATRLLPGLAQSSTFHGAPLFHQPFYALVVTLPFALLPDPLLAQAIWMVILEAGLVFTVVGAVNSIQWRIRPATWLALMLFSLLGMYSFSALVSGNIGILSALLGVAAINALRSERDELAGLALACATIQPEMLLLLTVLILGWAATQRRFKVWLWFLGGIFFLAGIGLLFYAQWPMEYLRTLVKYADLIPLTTPAESFRAWWPGVGRQLGWLFSGFFALVLLGEWIQVRGKDFRWFLWTACLTLVIGQWLGIPTTIENFVILLLPLVLVLGTLDQRVERSGAWLAPVSLMLLLVGLWIMFFQTLSSGSVSDLKSSFLFPLPFILLVGLYWVRWWCVRQPRLYLEDLKEYETRR